MQLKETREALNKFGKFVIQQARSRLTKGIKRGSKSFHKTIQKNYIIVWSIYLSKMETL